MRLNRASFLPKMKVGLLPAALIAGLAVPNSAQALSTGYQDAGVIVSFSKTGNGTTTYVPPKSFHGFNPALIPPSQVNPVLYGFRYYIKNVALGGTVTIGQFNAPSATPFTANPTVSLKLDSVVPGSTTPVQFTIPANTITGTLAAGTDFVSPPVTNTITAAVSPDLALPPPPGQFTVPNNVTMDYFTTSWSMVTTPNNLFENLQGATIAGQFGLEYVYTYVPGPLPILGAGAAFGWTRRLRRRISKSA
jgi:hypothetical protein